MTPPSFWPSWPSLEGRFLDAGELLLFLDYDGTLAPIAVHPSKASFPAPTKRLVRELACQSGMWVALVSGRSLRDLRRKVGLKNVCYVGNHGLELQGLKLRYTNPVARARRPILRKIAQRLRAILQRIPGAWVEDKELTLSIHYRKVTREDALLVKNGFFEVVQPYLEKRQVQVTTGKQVFEVRPPVRWTKGTIVQWLIHRRAAVAGHKSVLPVYIGDDQTDEDAFEALQSKGITVAVGRSPLSRAQYLLKSPADVQRFLRELLRVRKKRFPHGSSPDK